ncbi:MAG: polymerase, sigma-24 subunit, subfamily, partial [Verrucomicrobiales bacterium]|nr:polymerase, sigma-24 subunit, subfamily [Verrucomicrobiales bacterium]
MLSSSPDIEIQPPAVVPPWGAWLEAYLKGNEEAFAQLVHGTTPLVMAAALRRCGGRHALAQEAAQITFVDLARRAPSLRADATLLGWLHQRAARAAGDLMKTEQRRAVREQLAAEGTGSVYSLDDNPGSTRWENYREEVDAALARLKLEEHTAILLRCAEGLEFEAVGTALGCSAEAARKKVGRALEKVRASLARHRTGISALVVARGLAADHAMAASGVGGAGVKVLAAEFARTALATA